jgi:quinol-cytochrome oxidoreductase complex cytochrome b subunit
MATKPVRQDHPEGEHPDLLRRIGYSIFPGMAGQPEKPRSYRRFFNSLILHFRPRRVPERTLKFTLTWGLGGMAVVLVFLLIGTGLLLKFSYEPFPGRAYDSILRLQSEVLFGQLIRNVHHWSGNLLLIVAFLHFLRVFFTGAFHPPRQFNWIIGLALLMTVLLSSFTGYLLPWDQLAYWAITICTGMLEYMPLLGDALQNWIRSGREIGPATLSNFYAIHTAILPACILLLMMFHFWRVRKARGLVIPRAPRENVMSRGEAVPTIPNLILREVVVALVLIATVLMVSAIFDAPLEAKANPGLSPNPTKAPWYFMGFQEMLLHFHPLFALFLIPLLILFALVSIPYIGYPETTSGIWFASTKGRHMALLSALVAILATPTAVLVDEYLIDLLAWMPGVPPIISTGLIPFALVFAGVWGFSGIMKRMYAPTKHEAVQTLFVFFLSAFIILTVTGIWFRGPGMELVWPLGK